MAGLDLVILILSAFLLIKGIWKGFVKEIAGIAAVLIGVVLSFLFHDRIEPTVGQYIGEEYLSFASYALIFIATYLAIMLVGNLLDRLLKSVFLGGINRVLGGAFGLIKAVLWCTLLTYGYLSLQGGIGFEHPSWILESKTYPFFVDAVDIFESFL
jgi:membrane protein required for colicin V production